MANSAPLARVPQFALWHDFISTTRAPTWTLMAGLATFAAGAVVMTGWALGVTTAALVPGWRVMVPSTAFGFVCVGVGLVIVAARNGEHRASTFAVRLLAVVSLVLPGATLTEYLFGLRWGVESWLGFSFASTPTDLYAGRMSAVTAACFVLLGIALGSLTLRGSQFAATVRVSAGAALAISWLAVLAVAFDPTRLADAPRLPGMAALTIMLVAVASAGVLGRSTQTMNRLRDADVNAVLMPWILAGAFAFPLVLGQVHVVLARTMDPGLASAVVMVAFATAVTAALWWRVTIMQRIQTERRSMLANLETVVADRGSELAKATAQLRTTEDELRDASWRKDEFLAIVAHELRAPLAPIRMGVELLKRDGLSADVKTEAHRVIDRQMERMVRVIEDLLDVSRLTADTVTLRHERVDLVAVATRAIDASRPAIVRSRHTIAVDLPTTPIVVIADSLRLTQVVVNLVQNACKYTPAGGRLAVIGRVDGSHAELRVRDNGMGIPPAFLPRLFETFSQLSPSADRVGGGLGSGLALVQKIVSLLGGTIGVHSDGPGLGSEFTVRLTLAPKVDSVQGPSPTAANTAAIAPRRVMVVDDDEDNTQALAMLLRERGHVVETATDSEAALVQADRFRPDVVLLDIGMPRLNGYNLCKSLRRQPWGGEVRIVAQTAFGRPEDRRRSEHAGFDGHLVKPVNPAMLDAFLRP